MAASTEISPAVQTPLLPGGENDVVEGNVDYKGRPAKRSKSGGWLSASFVIGVEMAEFFTYYGVSGNLITYLTGPLGQSTATAAENVNAWSGAALLLPLFGAFVADSFLGRYRTVIVASLLYILALGLLALSAIVFNSFDCKKSLNGVACSPSQLQVITFFFSLYLVAIAQGMHKPSIHAFGADQFDVSNTKECKAKSSFFNWCAIGTDSAIALAMIILIYLQEYLSWGLGFGIPCLVMVFALLLFLSGTVTYRFHATNDHQGMPVLRIGQVFLKAVKNWRKTSSDATIYTDKESQGVALPSPQFKFLNKALLAPGGSMEKSEIFSVREVEEAKSILRLFPIWCSCLIYGIVFSQPATLFTKQGHTMERSIGSKFEIPAASLQAFSSVTIIVFLSIYDRILVPTARTITGKPSGITTLQRVGCGIFFSILCMFVAALVEMKRLQTIKEYRLADLPDAIVPMSVAWLIPQYLLLGISEALTIAGLQEFFYDQMPKELRSTGMALYLTIFGIGGFLSSILIAVIEKVTSAYGNPWFSDNPMRVHIDYFYWLLGGVSAMAFTAFVHFAKGYTYRKSNS